MNYLGKYILCLVPLLWHCDFGSSPEAVLPVPSSRQLEWHRLEYYAFIHFNMNTFSNMEWGMGNEDPSSFNPVELDCKQWAKVVSEAGMKGIIITAKHHDGFCLWPSKFTKHSIKYSTWKDGKGDVIRDLSDACKAYGLKFGVYYSPWDRNHSDYGKPEYITYMRRQLKELLTNYGEIFEVWFDGANGGTGYYGGANEERRVDKKSYYDWENTYELIREWQPNAVIFSDAGPDVRWVGNEHGFAYQTTWSNLMRDSVYGGMPTYHLDWADGQENGTHWVPAEADVSIRPGWYYHPYEDHKVKTLPQLLDIYYKSIGQNASLLLNFPVDTRGLIHEADINQLKKLTTTLEEDFKDNIAIDAKATASSEWSSKFKAKHTIDQHNDTYWCAADSSVQNIVTLDFGKNIRFNRIVLQEYIALGQRVKSFVLETWEDGKWLELTSGTTIGYKRIFRLEDRNAKKIRIRILESKGPPTLNNIEVYQAPPLMLPPEISRNQHGTLSMTSADTTLQIRYTLDGSEPDLNSAIYQGSFDLTGKGNLSAITIGPGNSKSESIRKSFDVSPKYWRIIRADTSSVNAIDGNPDTFWDSDNSVTKNTLLIDLGETYNVSGFRYLPPQSRYFYGIITEYDFATSINGKTWRDSHRGEFSNIASNPIEQTVTHQVERARYVILKAMKTLDQRPATFAEFSIITE